MEEQKIELKIINMADIQSQEIEWLWYPFVALINVDIQPHVITRKLNVLAGRLYTEHGILFRSERVHEGRKLRLWKDNTENA